MKRRKLSEPQSPFEYGQRVKIRNKAGLETTGKVSFIAYCPFPGFWCFEVTTDDGQVYKTTGAQLPGAAFAHIETIEEEQPSRIEQTEAGAQTVIPDTPARTIPNSKLTAQTKQKDGPLPLEMAELEAKQSKLF